MLEKEVISFNKSHYTDPIRIIWPEEELQLTEEDLLSNNLHNFRVERDKLIQKNIIETKNKTLPSQKGLILYGSGHGVKKSVIIKDDNSVEYEYKVFGSYLHDYYGKDFSTFLFWNVEPKQKSCIFLYSKDNDCRVLTDSEIKQFFEIEKEYDYYCVYPKSIIGVPNSYIPERMIIDYLITVAEQIDYNAKYKNSAYSDRSQQLFAIYYLKYHFGDNFRFNFFDDKTNLLDALNELKIIPIDKLFNLSELEEYMYYLYCNNWLKYYLENPECKDGINIIIKNMERANQLNPKDIFPQYWLAYFNTEKAIYSDKKADYKKALIEWNKVIQHELFTTSPVIKITYDKLAFCNEKLGNIEEAKLYKDKSKNVSKLLDFNYKEYMHFGW